MISTLDMLYLVLSLATMVVVALLVILTVHIVQILQDVKRISQRLEEISALIDGIAQVVFPGVEKVAGRASRLEEKVGRFIEKKVNTLLK